MQEQPRFSERDGRTETESVSKRCKTLPQGPHTARVLPSVVGGGFAVLATVLAQPIQCKRRSVARLPMLSSTLQPILACRFSLQVLLLICNVNQACRVHRFLFEETVRN